MSNWAETHDVKYTLKHILLLVRRQKVRAEILCSNGKVVRPIAVTSDTERQLSGPNNQLSSLTYYSRIWTPASSFFRSISVFGNRQLSMKYGIEQYSTLLRSNTSCAFFKSLLEQMDVSNCSESWIRFVRGSSSRYWIRQSAAHSWTFKPELT
jgi:hypothetical protein